MKTDLSFEPTRPESRQLAFDFGPIIYPKPVELLRDGRGVYGIGIYDFYREQEERRENSRGPRALVFRAGPFDENRAAIRTPRAFVKNINGFRGGIFRDTVLGKMCPFIHPKTRRRA